METLQSPRTAFVFVDGLGMGVPDPDINPVWRGDCPCLLDLVQHHAVPVDATLGMEGLPQSATGQTTLLTGINGAAAMGRHKEGLPGPTLRKVIRERNLFDLLKSRGYDPAFANAYYLAGITAEQMRRRQSVTTVMTLQALGVVRTEAHLERGEAVYNDLTRQRMIDRGYPGPAIQPEQAADDFIGVAADHDFTLFEFFLTDLVAHRGTAAETAEVLSRLDRFLARAVTFARTPGNLFLLLSDHGNIEDATTRSHTHNPVPLVALGQGAESLCNAVKNLEDFVPAVLARYPARQGFSPAAHPEDPPSLPRTPRSRGTE